MAKLTLSVNDEIIRAAKDYAQDRGLSVSQIVSAFFIALSKSGRPPDKMPPVLKRMAGILEEEQVHLESYHKHIANKYS